MFKAAAVLAVVSAFIYLIQFGGLVQVLTDVLIPLIPGEIVQSAGVYALKGICAVNRARRHLPRKGGFIECEQTPDEYERTQRVVIAVNKGGSVLGAKLAHETTMKCGWCMGMAHNKKTVWPPQPDELQDFESDIQVAIPMAVHWEKFAFKSPKKTVRCILLTRDPFKRFKSLVQYAWEGGEPALWEESRQMRSINGSWSDIVAWTWKSFGEQSMINTHEILRSGLKRKECLQIKFEDLDKNFDETSKIWLRQWNIVESAHKPLLDAFAKHDLNRLDPTTKAAHSHVSGSSLSKQDVKEIEQAFRSLPQVHKLLMEQSRELHYTN